ncbi:MAG: hypothetical protein AB7O24_25395 [Kofleriaceae bacterium]
MHRLALLVLLASCTPTSYAFSPTMRRTPDAKPEGCTFEVVTSQPSRGYEEIGTLTLINGEVKTLDDFKSAVAKQVCSVGGDAAIATGDAKGAYTKGSVIRYVPDGPSVPSAATP